MRDLIGAPAEELAAERARVATEGAGARLLALQGNDGSWAGAAWNRGWDSTMHVLSLLRELGLDPASDEARRAVGLVRDRMTWRGGDWDGNPFFAGEVEPCINGQVAASGAYFGQDVQRIVDRLLGEQLPDGGWNCEAANGSTRSSFNTTICVLEALLEYELAGASSAEETEARLRGQEYLLERRLFRRRSTGEVIERDRKGGAAWTRFSFPTWWHYDVLRGLEYRAEPAPRRTIAWPRRSSWSSRSATATASGCSRTSIQARWRSRWTTARAGRAGGTRCAPYGYWTGIQHETSADAAARRQATSRTGPFRDTTKLRWPDNRLQRTALRAPLNRSATLDRFRVRGRRATAN
jgi:hypothetical protein